MQGDVFHSSFSLAEKVFSSVFVFGLVSSVAVTGWVHIPVMCQNILEVADKALKVDFHLK